MWKRLSKRRILFTASTLEIGTSVNLSCNTNLITSKEKYHFRTHSTHSYTHGRRDYFGNYFNRHFNQTFLMEEFGILGTTVIGFLAGDRKQLA